MGNTDSNDEWSELGRLFVDEHYESLRGRVRTHVVNQHLRTHLPPPPLRIVDVGGGAGHQSIPLARRGYDVTIVEPSPAMLARASELLDREDAATRARVRLVESRGEDAPAAVDREQFGAVLCHGVVMYLEDPLPMIDALCALTAERGIVSIVAKNVDVLAVRPALDGDWATALAAFDSDRQINGLGANTRGDSIEHLTAALAATGVEATDWYGVRLFTDGWTRDQPPIEDEDVVFAVELEASRRDPYRQLSRLFHLVAQRR